MRLLGAVMIFALVSIIATSDSCADGVTYRRWLRNDLVRLEPPDTGTKGTIWFAPDAREAAMFCSKDSDFACFFSDRYAFAVPKKLDPTATSWEHEGVTFEVIERGLTISVLGRIVDDIVLIRAPYSAAPRLSTSKEDGYFLYSRAVGLVGFGYWAESATRERAYWLTGELGFGANP